MEYRVVTDVTSMTAFFCLHAHMRVAVNKPKPSKDRLFFIQILN
jgi:hypothetical protein